MKTYILKNWGNDRKITVEDDVQVSTTRGSRSENMVVTFSAPAERGCYDNNLIAAFDGIQQLYLEGLDIQVLVDDTSDRDECIDKHPTKQTWTELSVGSSR